MNLRKTLLIIGIGPLVGAVEVAGLLAYYRTIDAPIKLQPPLWMFIATLIWGLLLPLVVRWSERDPLRLGDLKRLVPLHVVRAVAISCATVALIGLVRWGSSFIFHNDYLT